LVTLFKIFTFLVNVNVTNLRLRDITTNYTRYTTATVDYFIA
jgi:hypothetical protein